MIDKIVNNPLTHTFEKVENVIEKLNHFKKISDEGLHKLSPVNLERLKKEFNTFLNINLTFWGNIYPTKLYRVTNNRLIYSKKTYKLQKISNLVGPPLGISGINRCNLKDESVFYAALDLKTALWETQPKQGEYITVSEWTIKPGQRLNNHFIFHPTETNLSKESKDSYEANLKAKQTMNPALVPIFHEIMKFFAEEFMKPVDEDKKNNYLFSAILSSRFLQKNPDENGFRIESISYPSVKRDHKVTNLAILNSLVFQKLDLTAATIFTVDEANYDISYRDRDDFIKVSNFKTFHKSFDFENDQVNWDLERELKDAVEMDWKK